MPDEAERPHCVWLSDDEVLLLDGRAGAAAQKVVDRVRRSRALAAASPDMPPPLAAFVAAAIQEAEENGRLACNHARMRSCPVCGARAGYATCPSLGMCAECWRTHKAAVARALEGVRAEIPEAITGRPPMLRRWDRMRCKCGWEGHEGQMGEIPALLIGTFRGKCPKCGAENSILGGQAVKRADGFVLVPAGIPLDPKGAPG